MRGGATPNKSLERTHQPVTKFAYANLSPVCWAAQLCRYASRIPDEAIGAGRSARILSAGSEAGNEQRHRRSVPVGASHITLSVSARTLQ